MASFGAGGSWGTMPRPVALTGTPGTGKSRVAAALAPSLRSIEVGELAMTWGFARPLGRGVEVDLPRLQEAVRRRRARLPYDLVVGHLAHLLPLRDVLVLRCQPEELARRLRSARRGSRADRQANYVSEALDTVLREAIGPGRRVWEVDTTGRTVTEVADMVTRRMRERGPSDYGQVDWLSDPSVTAHLLDPGP
jgi:adenylate kinase